MFLSLTLVLLSKPKEDVMSEDFDVIDVDEAISDRETTVENEATHVDSIEADARTKLNAHDVRFGVSHGYYKDLLNILALAANNQLKYISDPSTLLTQKHDRSKGWRRRVQWDAAEAKAKRHLWS